MPKVKFGVIVFPGSNCDHDAHHAVGAVMNHDVRYIWHKESSLEDVDVVIIPGGFSYGDYLWCGAIARFSPIMKDVVRFGRRGGVVMGICNGFQILTEAGLLPGALLRNDSLRFVCKDVYLRVENTHSRFTGDCVAGDVLRIPIAHGDGNFFADDETLNRLEGNGQVVFRYSTPAGELTDGANPNGSSRNIAGIINETGNILGMMPHPERACDAVLGNTDGQKIFKSLVESFSVHEVVNNLS